jgi:hypothetical protein
MTAVVAGLVLAIPGFEAQSKDNRGGRDKSGHDSGTGVWCFNPTGILSNIARREAGGRHANHCLA